MVAALKVHKGKVLTDKSINEIFAKIRALSGELLKAKGTKW